MWLIEIQSRNILTCTDTYSNKKILFVDIHIQDLLKVIDKELCMNSLAC